MEFGTEIRKPAFSGSFYPSNKDELISLLKKYFSDKKRVNFEEKIKAIIVPHAGYIYSGQTAACGYKQLPVNLQNPHFVLVGPSHHFTFTGLTASNCNLWQTPLGKIKQIAPDNKEGAGLVSINDEIHAYEHSLEVQLPFLQYLYQDFSISCLLTGNEIDFEKTANYLLRCYSSSIFIFSSDLSHYLPLEVSEAKDKKTIDAILNLNDEYFLSEENTACGMMGILILITIAKKEKWKRRLIYNDTSAKTSGDKNAVVGYAAIGFYK